MPYVLAHPSIPGLLVSDHGDVWVARRKFCLKVAKRVMSNGALAVTVNTPKGAKSLMVHRLVLETFVGPCPPEHQGKHLDGNPQNNVPDNLTWAARPSSENPFKPGKPYSDFPLFAHANGHWAKKIKGKTVYFGLWDDWRKALDAYETFKRNMSLEVATENVIKAQLLACPKTIGDLVDRFLSDKQHLLSTGELSAISITDYKRTCKRIAAHFNRQLPLVTVSQDQFTSFRAVLAKTLGLTALSNEIGRVRVVFNYAGPEKLNWMPSGISFGPLFVKPSKSTMRKKRAAEAPKDMTAQEIWTVLRACPPQLYAMTLLGINCGLGNTDCALLMRHQVDLAGGWITYPRPKTGIARRAKLWPEAVKALNDAWNARPADTDKRKLAEEFADRWFITRTRRPWVNRKSGCPISHAFYKILLATDLHRTNSGFYALRHTFQTVAEECGDFPAIRMVMGHADHTISERYRERISDDRLERVAETVREWWLTGK